MASRGSGGTCDLASDLTEDLECSVCLNFYKDPRNLKCGHLFCLRCLQRYQGIPRWIICPTCRQPTSLRDGGLASLGRAVHITSIIDKLETSKRRKLNNGNHGNCDVCMKDNPPPSVYCKDCRKKVCESCAEKHKKVPSMADHSTQTLDAVVFCDLHKQEVVSGFCVDCSKTVCESCLFTDHGHTHEIKKINDACKDYEKKIQNFLLAPEGVHSKLKNAEDYKKCILENVAQFRKGCNGYKTELAKMAMGITNFQKEFELYAKKEVDKLDGHIKTLAYKSDLLLEADNILQSESVGAAKLKKSQELVAQLEQAPAISEFTVNVPKAPVELNGLIMRLKVVSSKVKYKVDPIILR